MLRRSWAGEIFPPMPSANTCADRAQFPGQPDALFCISGLDRDGHSRLDPIQYDHRLEAFDIGVFVEEAARELLVVLHALARHEQREVRVPGDVVPVHDFRRLTNCLLETIDDVSTFALERNQDEHRDRSSNGLWVNDRDIRL